MFTIPKAGLVAGCYVVDGIISRASVGVRVIRDSVVVYEGKLGSLRRFKDDVRECSRGMSAVSRSRISMTSSPETLSKPMPSIRLPLSLNRSIEAHLRKVIGHDRWALHGGVVHSRRSFIEGQTSSPAERENAGAGQVHVSVAEVGEQDSWQKAILGLACVANESAHANQVLDQAVNFIRAVPTIQLVRSHIELL